MVALISNAHDRRVASYTTSSASSEIHQDMHDSLSYYSRHPERIDDRLAELAEEWDVERTLEANASTLIIASAAAAYVFDKRILYFTGVVAGFLLMHSIQGFCPPLPILRKMGVRTRSEIMYEQQALLSIQQDMLSARRASEPNEAVAATDPMSMD